MSCFENKLAYHGLTTIAKTFGHSIVFRMVLTAAQLVDEQNLLQTLCAVMVVAVILLDQ
jgi:hypothetical protein